MNQSLMPVLFVPHGGGPLPLLGDPSHQSLVEFMSELKKEINSPKAIVVITAHWEAASVAITAQEKPSLLFDYYGFPPEAYDIEYPVPGYPDLAFKISNKLEATGFKTHLEQERGYDHGTFVPLKLILPDASIPIIQISLITGLDPLEHIRLGQALSFLREEDVIVIGSGMSFHNMRAFFNPTNDNLKRSQLFDDWLVDCLTSSLSFSEKSQLLTNWVKAPEARFSHPREEHLLPLLVCFGVAMQTPVAERNFSGILFNTRISAFIWR